MTIEAACVVCDADLIDKDVHLFDLNWRLAKYHLMTGDGHYVIVLEQESISVQTLQLNTQPCMS